jgi:hypothetical protein
VLQTPADATFVWFWGVGMNTFKFPDNVGYRVGLGGARRLVLQMHYDNPSVSGATRSVSCADARFARLRR